MLTVQQWCYKYSLDIYLEKFSFFNYSSITTLHIGNCLVDCVQSYKVLGVINFCSDLSWSIYIADKFSLCCKVAFLLEKNVSKMSPDPFKLVYKNYILPILTYASQI